MRTQPPIEAEESQVGMQCSRSAVLHQCLGAAVSDEQARVDLYASLMAGAVYVEAPQILLTQDGPKVEFETVPTTHGPAVVAFSSRRRRRELNREALDAVAFEYLVHALPEGVGVVVDPEHECLLIEAQDIVALRGTAPRLAH
ncbi:MAG: hypothetical protein KUG77_16810 [Nannocystaceae bacterium]|nr:hypothetical protein [Nannocystaceae bacterium]